MEENAESRRETIYNQIVKDILRGVILPGEKLLESEIAKKFGVSRTPVREALLQLQKKNFVDYRRNAGCNVRKISIEEVEEAFDLVCVLEGYAVEQMVAGKLTQEDFSHIRSLQKELEECSRGKDYLKYMVKNGEFHGFFVKKCGNQTLLETVFDMRQKIYRINEYIGLTLPQYINLYIKDHRKLISLISVGKPLEAGKTMKDHVQRSKTLFIEALAGLRLTG